MRFCVDVDNAVPKRGSARCGPPLLEFIQQVSKGGFRRTKKKLKIQRKGDNEKVGEQEGEKARESKRE